jgi:ketosteroid isomerase-like protein
VSEENLKTFQAGVQAVNRGDIEGLLDTFDEGVVFLPLRSGLQGGYSGQDGVRRYLADTAEMFEVFLLEYSEVRDLGDQVLAIGTQHTRGHGSGQEIDLPQAVVASFQDGKVTRLEAFATHHEALKAVGLEG